MSTGQTKNENITSMNKLKEVKVNFNELNDPKDEKKSRFLTAKYGLHQMSLIRKRLQVESWVYDYLKENVCNVSGWSNFIEVHTVNLGVPLEV